MKCFSQEVRGLLCNWLRDAEDESLFFDQLFKSMDKMGNISPLTGFKGEVRKNCGRVDRATNYLLKQLNCLIYNAFMLC